MDDWVTPVATAAEPIRMLHAPAAAPAQARSDECAIAMLLHGRGTSPGIQRAYQVNSFAFHIRVRLPLREITSDDCGITEGQRVSNLVFDAVEGCPFRQ